jgi:general secretion pathway protein B
MSYILEALKKAQSERQMTSAPTIHAAPIQAAAPQAATITRTPLWMGVAALGLLAAGAGAVWLLRAPAAVAPVAVALAPAPLAAPAAPAMVLPPPVAATPAPQQEIVLPPPAPKPVVAPKAPPPAAAKPAPLPAPPVAKPAPEPAPVVAAVEDALPYARDLPEQVRSELPTVAFGGYMYSKNPADRLLLIDKVLRHEGEVVAPGLVLEKLLPKAAVMNYRGTRYRVAY